MIDTPLQILARLKQMKTQELVGGSEVRFLRRIGRIGFNYDTRNLPYHKQVDALIEIYTPMAIAERLTQ